MLKPVNVEGHVLGHSNLNNVVHILQKHTMGCKEIINQANVISRDLTLKSTPLAMRSEQKRIRNSCFEDFDGGSWYHFSAFDTKYTRVQEKGATGKHGLQERVKLYHVSVLCRHFFVNNAVLDSRFGQTMGNIFQFFNVFAK